MDGLRARGVIQKNTAHQDVMIRAATAADARTIKGIVRAAGINPMGLDWPRFLVAEEQGRVVGVGQVKPHRDGTRELASLAVIPERQGRGIGSAIIRALMAREPGVLYLTTNFPLEGYYQRFGFVRVEPKEMPSSLWWIYRISGLLAPITWLFIAGGVRIIVMKRGG